MNRLDEKRRGQRSDEPAKKTAWFLKQGISEAHERPGTSAVVAQCGGGSREESVAERQSKRWK